MTTGQAWNEPGPYRGEDDPRWVYTIETNGEPYLTRVIPLKTKWFSVYLHHFHRPDGDRHLHNHPWAWAASLLLSGEYDEERLDVDGVLSCKLWRASGFTDDGRYHFSTKKLVRWFNTITSTDYHAVTRLHGDVWTLFIAGPRVQDWGFLVYGKHVGWRDYLHGRS